MHSCTALSLYLTSIISLLNSILLDAKHSDLMQKIDSQTMRRKNDKKERNKRTRERKRQRQKRDNKMEKKKKSSRTVESKSVVLNDLSAGLPVISIKIGACMYCMYGGRERHRSAAMAEYKNSCRLRRQSIIWNKTMNSIFEPFIYIEIIMFYFSLFFMVTHIFCAVSKECNSHYIDTLFIWIFYWSMLI